MNKPAKTVRLAVALVGLTCATARGHTFGEGRSDLTPPMVAHAEEVAALRKDFGEFASPVRGVFRQMNLWNAGSTLKACFYDGELDLKGFFVRTAQTWLSGTSLKVDFGNMAGFSICSDSGNEDIRITFAKKGYW
jgi:hypothetical protein